MDTKKLKAVLDSHAKWLADNGGKRADLRRADLREADLRRADLREANLREADLRRADLREANLREANLRRADLRRADLRGADLPPPTMLLLCNWEDVSDKLCLLLMRYDASNHPKPEKFDEWAKGDSCPYNDTRWQRCANFKEKRELWKPGKTKSALELVMMLFKEKDIKR